METKRPPFPASKFKFFYFLPLPVMSPEGPSPARTPSPRPKKKRASSTALVPRSASTRVEIGRSFRFREPRSPRVSCIGNVASEKERKRRKDFRGRNAVAAPSSNQSLILKLLEVFKKKKETKAANHNAEQSRLPPGGAYETSAPKAGHVKKFFDRRVRGSSSVVAPHPPSFISRRRQGKWNEVAVVENIVLVPRKEINLWKKRMVDPPPPLVI
ncbi:hypothetical protein MLD38_004736 [Melastoma candidum]|uniref:Uncharacterized protein n=1 Tax=Melastoma candidum TaxID=119954 RepID=A0ACB9SBJ7_9MYRT|nr:hypothetical protein MLD38_004736 [Melastoma candidum]